MPAVIRLTQQKNHSNRYNCFLDNDERISITDDLIFKFDLSAGKELTEDELIKLKSAADRAFTREKAMGLLSLREHGSGELRTKLLQKGYEKAHIAEVLDYLKDKNYLNDERFAELYSEELIQRKQLGPMKVKEKLFQRGIALQVINSILLNYDREIQIKNCYFHFIKKFKAKTTFDTREEKAKAIRYLQGKGFSWDVIAVIINNER
ncbi:MAG: RecX family transcriptional regulator [Candidatus Marinimicrobia bacterium]|nr:RecX family transcriptional regulator [Candidatus Neomarinimicrobiota bacterium]